MAHDANDRESVRKRKARAEARRQRETDALRKVLSIPEGRRFVWAILVRAGVHRRILSSDTIQMAASAAVNDFVVFELLPYVEQVESGLFVKLTREFGRELEDGGT